MQLAQTATIVLLVGFAVFGVAVVIRAKKESLWTPRNRVFFVGGFLASVILSIFLMNR